MKNKKMAKIAPDVYPMRINKYLAHKGVATRTGVDELIRAGKVMINDRIAKLGDKILKKDKVEVRGKHTKKKLIYFAYNKPKGVVSTNPKTNEKDILQGLNLPTGVFPVGRLDKESHGLIILTNDGRVTDRLLNPMYNHEKEYVVKINRHFTPGFLQNMRDGVKLANEQTKKALVKKIGEETFDIILTEGKNRQIRRMTEKLGYTVQDLQRLRIQNIELGKTHTNSCREINGNELLQFLKSIGL